MLFIKSLIRGLHIPEKRIPVFKTEQHNSRLFEPRNKFIKIPERNNNNDNLTKYLAT